MAGGGPRDTSVLSDHYLGQLYGVTKVNGILDTSLLYFFMLLVCEGYYSVILVGR